MTSQSMQCWRAEWFVRVRRWLLPVALLALTPKCVLCVLAYAGVGAALGFGGAELCASGSGSASTWVSPLAWLGVAGGLVVFGCRAYARRSRTRPAGSGKSNRLT